jgi:hypothetical protein
MNCMTILLLSLNYLLNQLSWQPIHWKKKSHGHENIVFEHLDPSSPKTNQILVKETQHVSTVTLVAWRTTAIKNGVSMPVWVDEGTHTRPPPRVDTLLPTHGLRHHMLGSPTWASELMWGEESLLAKGQPRKKVEAQSGWGRCSCKRLVCKWKQSSSRVTGASMEGTLSCNLSGSVDKVRQVLAWTCCLLWRVRIGKQGW